MKTILCAFAIFTSPASFAAHSATVKCKVTLERYGKPDQTLDISKLTIRDELTGFQKPVDKVLIYDVKVDSSKTIYLTVMEAFDPSNPPEKELTVTSAGKMSITSYVMPDNGSKYTFSCWVE